MEKTIKNELFSFDGVTKRGEYITLILFLVLISYVSYNFISYFISNSITVILSPIILWIFFAISTKRLHDFGKSGFSLFLLFIPILGPIYVFSLLFFKKSKMSNKGDGTSNDNSDYFKNPNATRISGLDGSSRIVSEVTQLYSVLVSKVEKPRSKEEIIDILKSTKGPISVGGGRFSMGGQTASQNSTHLDMRSMNKVIDLDIENKIIIVEPGIRWCDIQKHIDQYDLSISIMQTYANFTVGGSLSVNVHGRYIGLGPLVLSVNSIKIVLASGELKEASRTKNKEIFFGVIGGYNALGVIVEAELKLEENICVKRMNKKMKVSEYRDYFVKNIRSDKKSIFHNGDMYPPYYKNINSVTWEKTNDAATTKTRLMPGKSYTIDKVFFWIFSELPFGKWMREYVVDPMLFLGKKVHYRNYEAGYDVADLEPFSRRNSTYVLLEYFIPIDNFEKFTDSMSEIFNRYQVNIINVSMRHAHPDTETYMSWAREEVFAFVVYYKQATTEIAKNKVAIWTREVEDAAIAFNGSYYLPYQAHATVEQFHSAFPNAKKLLKLKTKLDPNFRFRNIIWDTYYTPEISKDTKKVLNSTESEFKLIFSDTHWRDQFYLFLQNVYHLYPEDKFHYLITQITNKYNNDKDIYNEIQKQLPHIKTKLSDVTYALPALKKQKNEMINQTQSLLADKKNINGYVEIGSTGRYINSFKKAYNITGPIYTVEDIVPDNSLAEIFERGQISKASDHHISYKDFSKNMEKESIDLMTCFIGLHHVPVNILDGFIKNIYDTLRPGGVFILRDHNADSEMMVTFCSLVHTVFNLGLNVAYEEDEKEYKNLHSITYWGELLKKHGFVESKKQLLQHKDPSKNTLVMFTKK